MKRTLTILAAILLLASVCSCQGDTGKDNGGTTGTANGTGSVGGNTADTEAPEYVMPTIDMKGEDVVVLNIDDFAEMKIDFVVEEDADDTLDVAIYESNMRMQQQFNFTFIEEEFPYSTWDSAFTEMADHFIKNVSSGDDVYDLLHYPTSMRVDLITRGYLMDLSDYEQLQFDKPWWDTNLNKSISINGRQYMASGSINLMPYEGMTTIFFNKQILANNGLDSPYDMVRDGTWTLDNMLKMAQDAMTLGTDASWGLADGTSVAGITMHNDFPSHFLVGAGITFVKESNGDYSFDPESDDFYTAIEKILPFFTYCSGGGVCTGDASIGPNNNVTLFSQGRALFCMSELNAGVKMRDAELEYGILPTPKLREEQENYYTDETLRLHFISIPTTSENPDKIASILDAMAYDRYKNVVPVYYDSYVAYKGLRDEESIEMLEIMRAGRTMDTGMAYGWCLEPINAMNRTITKGTASSIIASYKDNVNDDIDAIIDEYLS